MPSDPDTTIKAAAFEEAAMSRDLLVRLYLCLDWIVGEGLGPWPPESAPDPDDLYLELGEIVNPDGKDARDVR